MSEEQDFKYIGIQVKRHLDIDFEQMQSMHRKKQFVHARILFSKLAKCDGHSYSSIGKFLNRDHSSIMYFCKKYEEYPKLQLIFDEIQSLKPKKEEIKKRRLSLPKSKYSAVFEKYNGKCAVPKCEFDEVLELHHLVPKYLGGLDDIDNLVCLCPNHHRLFDRGLILVKDIHKN